MNLQSFGSSPQLQAMQFRSPSPIAQQGADDKGDAGDVAGNFEEVFQRLIMKEMLPKDGGAFFGHSAGAETFKDFFVAAVAKPMAQRDALGIKDVVEAQMIRAQGHAHNDAANTITMNLGEKGEDDESDPQE